MSHAVILIGGTAGLGLRSARLLAARGWTVVVTGRDLSPISERDRAAGIIPIRLDLGSLAAVDDFVDALADADLPPIRGLICNAGTQLMSRQWSADGHELTMAVNVLAPLLLIDRLIPVLEPGARVVWTSSGTHDPDRVAWLPPAFETTPLEELLHPHPDPENPVRDGLRRYATSKLCGARIVPHLARALPDVTVTVNSFDPGLMPGTQLARGYPSLARPLWVALRPLLLLIPGAHRVGTSARHLADLLTEERFARMTGAYVVDDHPAGSSIASHDAAASERLFRDALDAVGARHLSLARTPA